MNNLILATILAATAAALCVRTQFHINGVAARNVQLAETIAGANATARAKRAEVRRWESIATLERSAFYNLQAGATKPFETQMTEAQALPTNPAEEGYWPAQKEYFYLSKKHLRGLNYSPVTDEENISEAAGLLFGMSPTEVNEANETYHRMRAEIRALELARAFPTNAISSWIDKQPGNKTTIRVPKLPEEELNAILDRFKSGLQQTLGADRANLLNDRIQEVFQGGRFAYNSDRTFTIVRNGARVQYFVEDSRGSSVSGTYTPVKGEPDDSTAGIPRDFAHLFLTK
jgi:hypothetical protein